MFLVFFSRNHPLRVLAAVVNVYGAILLFHVAWRALPATWRKQAAVEHPTELPRINLAVILTILGLIALGGGGNTERLLYWGLPFLVLGLAPEIDEITRAPRGGPPFAAS